MANKPSSRTPAAPPRRPFEPVVQESTASMIANRVRDAIAQGHIAPGTQLGEAELARELGVSRGPLREGLQRLTAEGLLVSIRNRGLFVIEITPERVGDVYVARQAVERAAAEQIHLRDPRAAGAALMTIIEAMAVAPDSHAVGDADIAFHERLVALAESPRLTRMHNILLIESRVLRGGRGRALRGAPRHRPVLPRPRALPHRQAPRGPHEGRGPAAHRRCRRCRLRRTTPDITIVIPGHPLRRRWLACSSRLLDDLHGRAIL